MKKTLENVKNKFNLTMLGFTLVELMGVILILCLISFLMVPTIIKQIKNSKSELDDLTEKLIVSATELYLENKLSEFPKSEGSDYCITLQDLVNDKKIVSPLVDSSGNQIDLESTVSIEVIDGKYKYTVLSDCRKVELMESYVVSTYSYRGESVVFRAPQAGIYQIELWGAEGGYNSTFTPGKGAYTSGEIELTKGEVLYVTVGQKGSRADATDVLTPGGYNGGGGAYYSAGTGGGATDIRYGGTTIYDRIMVAGGGGGTGAYSAAQSGGSGASFVGQTGGYAIKADSTGVFAGLGGTQISGGMYGDYWTGVARENCPAGTKGEFLTGGNGGYEATYSHGSGGGGGGYYGGGGGTERNGGGGGGSSYISGHAGCVAITSKTNTKPLTNIANGSADISHSYHYSGKKFTNTKMISGASLVPTHDGNGSVSGNSGDGYAKITFLKEIAK